MRNLIWHQTRADAQRFQCTYCHKPVGEVCVNPRTGDELERQPAHFQRLQAAGYGSMVTA